jgi:multidrug efflux pump subunit AcrB
MDELDMSWDDQTTKLTVKMSMPDGATLEQMNKVFLEWENFLAGYKEVERFISTVRGIDNSTIEIFFTEEAEMSIFPYVLKQKLETKAIETGGADTGIYGVGRGFNNSLGEGYKSCRIELKGYNYDQLVMYARNLKDSLLVNPRIQEVIVQTGSSWRGKPKYEFVMQLAPQKLAANSSSIQNVYNNLAFYSPEDINAGYHYTKNEAIPIVIREENKTNGSIWNFNNNILVANKDFLRLKDVGSIQKERTGSLIRKKNQQYSINVEYDFIGPYQLSNNVMEQNIEKLGKELPLGYSVANSNNYGLWNRSEKTQYGLLVLVIGVIYFICAILLESLTQPLVVIATIPISFIGLFLTFAIFKLKFDQGGYASMILLCGITVNSALYIINDYNNNRKANPAGSRLKHYMKAYNHKIIPILLTILSTILGMIPFLIGGQKEGFWFSLACGAIGGLIFSVLAIVIWLPLFMKLNVTKVME